MKNIMTLEEFLMQNDNISEINEGLLTNLFGALLKRDMWSMLDGNEPIKREFREIDDKLNGFYLTKIKNPNVSQDIRQTLVNWAGDIYKAKSDVVKEREKNSEKDGVDTAVYTAMLSTLSLNKKNRKELEKIISDKKMLEKMTKASKENIDKLERNVEKIDKKYQKELDEFTSSSAGLKKWANILKSRMDDIIDNLLVGEYGGDDGDELAKDLEKYQNEKDRKMEKENKEAMRDENKEAKEIDKNRKDLFNRCNVTITTKSTAKDFINEFVKTFDDESLYESFEMKNLKGKEKVSKEHKDFFEKNLGIKIDDVEKGYERMFGTIFSFNRDVLSDIDKKFSNFDRISGESIQALTISYCNILFYAYGGNATKISDEMKDLIAHCAMSSNVEIGFGLPYTKDTENLPEPKEGEDDKRVGMLTYYIEKTNETLNKSNEGKPIAATMDKIVGDVMEMAKEIVKKNNEKKKAEAEHEARKEKQEENK